MILFGIRTQFILIHVGLERQRGKGEGVEPDTAGGEDLEDTITFVGVVCTRTATAGEEGGEDVDVDGAGGTAGGFPSLAAPLSRLG